MSVGRLMLATAAFGAGLATASSLLADDAGPARDRIPGVAQEVLVSAPLGQFPGKRITVFTGTFAPGASTPLHRHPGTEVLYVLEGAGSMEVQGRGVHELTTGRAVLVEADRGSDSFVHRAINGSESEPMKTLVFVIHDDGTPPAQPLEALPSGDVQPPRP